MGPSWPSIEHGHSGITAHLETATFNVCETLNLGVVSVSVSSNTGRRSAFAGVEPVMRISLTSSP